MPYFEAGTECFIRDWCKTVVHVQVHDMKVLLYQSLIHVPPGGHATSADAAEGETGTLKIVGRICIEPEPSLSGGFDTKKLEICVVDNSYKVLSLATCIENRTVLWNPPVDKMWLLVYNRYLSAVVFEISSGGIGPITSASDFLAVCWFKNVPGNNKTQIWIPIIKSPHLKQLRQNYSVFLVWC
ncbi:uncharacterized protein PHACADRAFT_201963 [Phanerochaete carnosa HHB-10118-sp]|uniref:Meiotically up-regulated Mug190 protein third C2 domain-containing protein n=1 Tax=Phanerochaete carnosa (strain HHB-10118-sp) TaxID=650164 RepID=K5VRE3_PHACS|nr:uncharacterized protein PHACADRAFT_201963 [Phanerochaete carnosa HHB-10118-sp]EKM49154.1 hypothetical protein PHACADRAFT_201963 [Phanerochaete carnosa HHB-10118-sp]